jgi:Arm DNA-binding domain
MAKALTVAAVEKARADPGARREIPDGLLAGLYLIVQQTGAKSWAVRYRRGTRSRKHTLGRYPALGLLEAREQARKALQRVQAGGDPALDKRIERRRAAEGKDNFEPWPVYSLSVINDPRIVPGGRLPDCLGSCRTRRSGTTTTRRRL